MELKLNALKEHIRRNQGQLSAYYALVVIHARQEQLQLVIKANSLFLEIHQVVKIVLRAMPANGKLLATLNYQHLDARMDTIVIQQELLMQFF